MNHSDVRNHMPDYLEGDLPLDHRALFDAHLDECTECAGEIAEMRATIAALRAMPDPEVPHDLADRVMRRVRAGESRSSFLDQVRAAAAMLFEPKILAPASAAMIAAGILLGTGQLRTALEDGQTIVVPGQVVVTSPDATAVAKRLAPGAYAPDEHTRAPVVVLQPPARLGPIERGPGDELISLTELLAAQQSRRTSPGDWPATSTQSAPAPTMTVSANPDRRTGSTTALRPRTSLSAGTGGALPSSEEWLAHAQHSPAEFAERMAARTLAEQELWVRNLARHAVEQGSLDRVVASLRSSESRPARLLADEFETAGALETGRSSFPETTARRSAD